MRVAHVSETGRSLDRSALAQMGPVALSVLAVAVALFLVYTGTGTQVLQWWAELKAEANAVAYEIARIDWRLGLVRPAP